MARNAFSFLASAGLRLDFTRWPTQRLKSLALEPQVKRTLEDHLSDYVKASFRSQNVSNIAGQFSSLIHKFVTLGIIWLGSHLVIENQITVGQLVVFKLLADRVSGPILTRVQMWQDFQLAGISIQRLGDIRVSKPLKFGRHFCTKSILVLAWQSGYRKRS